MTKRAPPSPVNENPQSIDWQDKLPSTYETLTKGFHAALSVEEMTHYLGMKIEVPKKIRKIPLGSFTPEIYGDEEFSRFWNTPVHSYDLVERPEVFNALNDPDFAEVQKFVGYDVKPCHPTLETLARMTQTQYLGFQARIAELTSPVMFERVGQLREPKLYNELRNCAFVKNNKLQKKLPKAPPLFEFRGQEFSVKSITSATQKAYARSGKAGSKDAFLSSPEKCGVWAVTDIQRATITPVHSGQSKAELRKDYQEVRDVLSVGMMSGMLGIFPVEITDKVLYPRSGDVKEQFPVCQSKGIGFYVGPKGKGVACPVEIQIGILPEYAVKASHISYEMQRDTDDKEIQEQCIQARLEIFKNFLSAEINDIRFAYTGKNEVMPGDNIAQLARNTTALPQNAMKEEAIKKAFGFQTSDITRAPELIDLRRKDPGSKNALSQFITPASVKEQNDLPERKITEYNHLNVKNPFNSRTLSWKP